MMRSTQALGVIRDVTNSNAGLLAPGGKAYNLTIDFSDTSKGFILKPSMP